MSTCRWCTLSGSDTTEFLKEYATNQLSPEDLEGSNDDLCYCLECVVEYHKAREKLPRLHQILWELETSRLLAHMEKSMKEEDEEDDELYLVEEKGDTLLSGFVGPDFENNLRVPLLEILKYPYLLLHERVSELCVEVLCRMEQSHSSFQVFEKYPGIYLFLVHPNEVIRRWAILTARNLGKVDRDDYYDLQEVLTCLFRVIELGLFESPDIYSSTMLEKGKLILLPSHLYDTTNYKNYWLGICMLLTVLEEEAMDSLLLGPDKQNDFMQSILHTMEKEGDDDSTDPFWPALHCFMVILDQLGSKVWGQLIDPVQAFQTIINSVSYNNEIENMRSSFKRTKSEPEPAHDDDITCSQIVYNYNTEKPQKDAGWKAAICPNYCPSLYEDMQTMANLLQSELGRDMRVHESTFLWFIPFVQSLMDLKDLGVAYIVEVIHYLCSEIKDTLNVRMQQCDKIAEFFLLILVSIVELHRNKKCLHLLWISSQEWVEAVVRCAKLPATAFARRTEKGPGLRGSPGSPPASSSVQHACVQLIRSLLKEGYQIGQQALCKRYLNKLNLLLRGNLSLGWQLSIRETQELQVCLRQVVRSIKDRPIDPSAAAGNGAGSPAVPAVSVKQDMPFVYIKEEKNDDGYKLSVHGGEDLSSPAAVTSKEKGTGDCQENAFLGRKSAWEEKRRDPSTSTMWWMSTKGLLGTIKKEADESPSQNSVLPKKSSLAAKLRKKAREKKADVPAAEKCHLDSQSLNPSTECSDCRRGSELGNQHESVTPVHQAAPPRVGSHKRGHSSGGKESSTAPSSSSNPKADTYKLKDLKVTIRRIELPPDLRNYSAASASKAEADQPKLGHVPPSSANKRDLSSPASQSRPLALKCDSSDRLLEFSEYFKRQNSAVRKKEEGIMEVNPEDSALTDSQVDRELCKLSLAAYAKGVNFPFDSSQESSVHDNMSDVTRKVKGAVRSSSDGQGRRPPCDDVNKTVVVLDSSDESVAGEETKQVNAKVSLDKQPLTSSCISELKSPGSPLSLEEFESQCFEFETDEDVYSVWSDTQAMAPTQEYKQDQLSTAASSSNSGDAQSDDNIDHTIEWGYEVDYITDEMMEEEATIMEERLEDTSHHEEGDDIREATIRGKQLEDAFYQEDDDDDDDDDDDMKEATIVGRQLEDASYQEDDDMKATAIMEKQLEDPSHQEDDDDDDLKEATIMERHLEDPYQEDDDDDMKEATIMERHLEDPYQEDDDMKAATIMEKHLEDPYQEDGDDDDGDMKGATIMEKQLEDASHQEDDDDMKATAIMERHLEDPYQEDDDDMKEATVMEKQLEDPYQEDDDDDGDMKEATVMEKQLEDASHQEDDDMKEATIMEKHLEDPYQEDGDDDDGDMKEATIMEKQLEDASHQEGDDDDDMKEAAIMERHLEDPYQEDDDDMKAATIMEKCLEDASHQEHDNRREATIMEKQLEGTSHQEDDDDMKEATSSVLQESVSKGNVEDQLESLADKGPVAQDFTLASTEPRASTSTISLASKLALKRKSASPRKSMPKAKVQRTIQRSPKKPPPLKPAQSKLLEKTSVSQPDRSLPVVVPPRKVRQCPAPTSTVEKLGLKKAPRKAFELSQRSLESIVELRTHGKAAGRVGLPQKRKTKPIAAQSLSIKYNKKFLACQDRQYLRQMRPPKRAREPLGGSERRSKVSKVDVKVRKPKPPSSELAPGEGSVENQRDKKRKKTFCPSEETRVSELLTSLGSTRRSEDHNVVVSPVPTVSSLSSTVLLGTDKDEPSGKGCVVQPECEKVTSTENGCEAAEDSGDDDDDLFLTQLDPVDMELCSQVESAEGITIASKKPEEMANAESLHQSEPSAGLKCQHAACVEKVGKPGEYCRRHSASSSEDHVFAKPLLPPSKPRKPSTTKIFSSASSSRSAVFSKDLEDGKKLPPGSKSKASAAKQAVVRPPGVRPVPAATQAPRPPSSSSIPQPYSYGKVLQSHNRQNEVAPGAARGAARGSHSASLGAPQRDNNTFVNEVLNWTYESIANFSQFGPPSNLLQSIVAPVPVHFQGYNDYFNTFFPLMMLNAFETLAQGWMESQRGRGKSYYLLCKSELPDFRADVNTAHFEAHLREVDLARQLHPKEDDVVFLVVQNKKDTFKEGGEMENSKVYHVGLVTRFYRASGSSARQKEQHTVYHVSVQTRGNLSFSKNKQVKCVVVGSLVTTRREFRSLLLLSRSPLAKPIINPSYNDFCPRDLPVASESATSDMNDYNEGQKRAIETAYAMVKQHPGLPKICLIHGPPGTGKSKTIVGLLSRVLRENTRSERTARKTNPKIKPNRFLVCAPSNAAVDELMKKIIIAFKGKCQNRLEPLGNCGDIKLVRIGAEKAINSEVLGFSLDKQVQHRMKRKTADLERDIQKKKESIDQRLDELIRQRAMNKCGKRESQMIDDEFNKVSKEREHLASQLKEVRAHSQKVQAEIILESDIICCTLSASGGGLLESTLSRQGVDPFSCVIVDEAGQSCEVETLIPLIHRCNKLVLVGDPRQLPPTVKSVKAQENGYDQSLMARLHRHLEEQMQSNVFRSLPVVQLTVQYRMHPDICLFPSNYVYGRTLKTDKATEENRCSSDWPFQPYLIFDVGDGREERDNDSFSNPQEVKLVMELIKVIKARRKDLGLRRIGIITPYSAQKKRIQRQLDKVFGNNSPGEVDTVDAFQGREKDCIIVTCVRANTTKGSIGFLASLQRLNVTITRARFSLFILGRLETLMENKDWNQLVQDAHKRGAIIKTSEEVYKRDALKILKLRPTGWCPTKAGTKTPALQPSSSSGKRVELAKPREASSNPLVASAAGHAAPQGSRGPQQAQGAQAVDSSRGSAPTPVEAAAAPAAQEKPRDPRRAGMVGRTEAKGREQDSKGSSRAAQSTAGTMPQQGFEVSSASRDQSSRAEASKKPSRGHCDLPSRGHCDLPSRGHCDLPSRGHCDLPSKSPSLPRQEHDRRAGVHSKGGHDHSSRRSRDSDTSSRTPENTEHSSAKRRKTSH